jgi:uncharacterized membrane protein
LESLLIVFIASKEDIKLIIYPAILIVAVSILLLSFGYVFKRDVFNKNARKRKKKKVIKTNNE